MLRIGICEDNPNLKKSYQQIVHNIFLKKDVEYEIVLFSDGGEVIACVENNSECLDILLLDIFLVNVHGIETAITLRKLKSKVEIIFLSSSEECMLDTMDINPSAYLLKDQLTQESFERAMLCAIKNVKERVQDVHQLNSGYTIAFRDVCYIKIQQGVCCIHHEDGTVLKQDNLEILQMIKEKDFFQVHQNYVVGLRYIQDIKESQVVLTDSAHSTIPLEYGKEKELKLVFAEYMLRQI